jgi:hypothetical protein
VQIPPGSIAWKKGIFWKYVPPPYNQLKPVTLAKGVSPVGADLSGGNSPYTTIQKIGESTSPVPSKLSTDDGVVDVFVSGGGTSIQFVGKGEQTNVGKRIASTTQGMSVEDGEDDGGGSTGISRPDMTDYYPEHSVSRPHIVKTGVEPVRNGSARETQGKDRVDITERTEQMLSVDSGDYEDYEATATAKAGSAKPKRKREDTPYFDEDPEWLDSLEPDILRTKKKTVNRVKFNRQKARKATGNVTAVRSMRSR